MVLARLNHRKANPGGAVKVGAESAMHFNLDRPGWVCYFGDKAKFIIMFFDMLICYSPNFALIHLKLNSSNASS